MRKYVCGILSYLLIGVAIVVGLDWLFAISYNFCSMMMQEMYQHPESINTLFMGSSHTYRSYDPKLADEMLEIETFNLGSSSQLPVTTYYLLKEVEKKHKIDTVYLDTFFGVYISEISPDELSLYRISDYMKGLENKIEYLWEAGGIRGLENGILCRYRRNLSSADIKARIRSERLAIDDYSRVTSEIEEYCGKGFVYTNLKIEQEIDFKEAAESFDLTNDIPMSNDSYKYLIKIINYCKENNINLILVDQPMPDELLSEVKGYDHYVVFLSELAEEYEIDYMNFNLYKGYEKSLDDYYDTHHLNGPGAEKYTEIFCNTVNALKNHEKTMEDLFYQEYSPDRGNE